jgi:hypothetical protein
LCRFQRQSASNQQPPASATQAQAHWHTGTQVHRSNRNQRTHRRKNKAAISTRAHTRQADSQASHTHTQPHTHWARHVRVCAYVRACGQLHASDMHACVRVTVRACGVVCVCACAARACGYACVHACVRACVRASIVRAHLHLHMHMHMHKEA